MHLLNKCQKYCSNDSILERCAGKMCNCSHCAPLWTPPIRILALRDKHFKWLLTKWFEVQATRQATKCVGNSVRTLFCLFLTEPLACGSFKKPTHVESTCMCRKVEHCNEEIWIGMQTSYWISKSFSSCAQYVTLQNCTSHPSLAIYSSPTSPLKLNLGWWIANT